MTDHDVPMPNGVIVAVIILVTVTGITIVVVAVSYWRINRTSKLQTLDCTQPSTMECNNATACLVSLFQLAHNITIMGSIYNFYIWFEEKDK